LLAALDHLMCDATAGDPVTGLKWTHKSLRALQHELARRGYRISTPTVARLLRASDYSFAREPEEAGGQAVAWT